MGRGSACPQPGLIFDTVIPRLPAAPSGWQGGWSYPLNRSLRSHDLTLFVIFVLRREILFNKVIVIRQLGKIVIYKTT